MKHAPPLQNFMAQAEHLAQIHIAAPCEQGLAGLPHIEQCLVPLSCTKLKSEGINICGGKWRDSFRSLLQVKCCVVCLN